MNLYCSRFSNEMKELPPVDLKGHSITAYVTEEEILDGIVYYVEKLKRTVDIENYIVFETEYDDHITVTKRALNVLNPVETVVGSIYF